LLLDRAGYTTDKPLSSLCALDPGCGDGVIVGEMVRRMVQAAGGRAGVTVDGLLPAIRAIELDAARLARTRRRLLEILSEAGFDQRDAHRLVATWCVHGDLLGDGLDGPFDVIAGNPPYLSYAHTPEAVRRELRARFKCYRGRADLYVACIERCLDLLGPDGRLAAITPNRWLKREYGRPLQELVQLRFSLDLLIDAETAELFEQPVQAYPVIAVIRRGSPARTVNVSLKGSDASKFASVMTREAGPGRLNAFVPSQRSRTAQRPIITKMGLCVRGSETYGDAAVAVS
jgi:SAM-dependent methyltransferase